MRRSWLSRGSAGCAGRHRNARYVVQFRGVAPRSAFYIRKEKGYPYACAGLHYVHKPLQIQLPSAGARHAP